ncbi:MAG: choice-of-anchor D domain-containing protein, partial [Deltaproteobacteria bacterium]
MRLLLTVAVTTACPGCSSKNTTTPDGSLACTEDSDCPNGQFCDQGICRPAGGDSDTACVDDIDCPDGMVCVEGSCKQVQDGGSVEESAAPEPDIEIIDPPLTGDPPVYLLDFGSVMVGQVVSRNISIRNAGDSDLRIIELSKEMGTSDEFYLDQALLDSLPLVVPPGQQTSIEVFYLAADGFSDTGVLNIISNDPDEARVPVQLSSTFKGTAKIAVDPARIDFGDVPVGLSGKMDITISNQGSGNAVLTLQAVQLASLVTDNFEIENPPSFPYYLNRGDVLVLSVMFHPGQAASFSDKLVVLSDDPASDRLEIPVSGRGVEPSLVVEPSPIDIGEVALGSSASVEVTVRNDGGAPLSITGIELANGTNEFQLTSDPQTGFDLANIGPANPQVLDAGEARKLTITYTPSDEGADSATLEIGSPDIEPSPRQVAVQATGFMPPVLSVQPLALDFGQQHVRGMSTLPVELRNDGGRILQFSSLQVSGIDSFSYSPASVPSLAAGQRFELQVTFAPLTTGTHLATLQISSNDPANPQVDVGLRGEGIDPNIFVWPPPPIDFGQIYRGTSSTQTIRIYSVGIGPLEVYSIELLPSPSDFSLLNVPALPATISNSSEWIEFDIKYAPPSVGADSVALRIESSDLDNSTLVVNVQGEAIGCPDGWWDIDGDPQNGCEYRCYQSNNGDEACDYIDNDCDGLTDEDFDVTSDPQNCGACNQDCVYNHATAVCNNGVCGLGACDPNFWNANGDDSDGCEYACVQSNGGIEACDGIDNDCDGATDEDFDLQNDPMNCGGCGNQCLLYNATSVCIQGTCRIGSCQVGYDNCDLNDVNGCETDLKADPDNCGTCGNVCSFPNAPALCNNGTCQPGDCSSGFLDCNNDPTDGCETNAQTDAQNCGSCGTACDPGESCESGQCRCGAVGPDCQNGLSCCGIDCV